MGKHARPGTRRPLMILVGLVAIGTTIATTQLVNAATRTTQRDPSAPNRASAARVHAAATTESGFSNRFDAVTETADTSTTSTSYVDMPSMSVTFHQGGKSARSVIVSFQGEWIGGDCLTAGTQARAFLRLQLDGSTVAGPGENGAEFAPHEGSVDQTDGFIWVTPPVSPGSHTATIQWGALNADGNTPICVDERTMVVEHR